MDIKRLLGKRLQEIRKSKKLTQEQVAELIGVETTSISNIESGRYFPSSDNLDKILKVFNVRPSDVFAFESFAPIDDLIDEMTKSMKSNEKLARTMYKFYTSVKF